jgi:hypothetical protein
MVQILNLWIWNFGYGTFHMDSEALHSVGRSGNIHRLYTPIAMKEIKTHVIMALFGTAYLQLLLLFKSLVLPNA